MCLGKPKTVNTMGPTVMTDEFFSYSPRGELTDFYELTPHSGGYYHTSAAYWASGSLQSLSGIPSVPTLYYGAGGGGLDGEGRYTQVTAGSGTNPVTGVTYSTSSTSNPLGALTNVTYGSSDSDSFTYDPTRAGSQHTHSWSTAVLTMGRRPGTPTGRWPAFPSATAFPAPAIRSRARSPTTILGGWAARIRTATAWIGLSTWQQLFTGTTFLGRSTKAAGPSFAATYSSATNQFGLSGGGISYDANGNLLSDNLNSYTWDPNWGST